MKAASGLQIGDERTFWGIGDSNYKKIKISFLMPVDRGHSPATRKCCE
jgi:hypothetical protein